MDKSEISATAPPARPAAFWPDGWWRVMDARIGVVPIPVFVVVIALITAFAASGRIAADLPTSIAVLAVGGFACAELGKRLPGLRQIGAAAILATFIPSYLVYAHLLPAPLVASITDFTRASNVLYLFIAAIVVGSIFGMDRRLLVTGFAKIFAPLATGSVAAMAVGSTVGWGLGLGLKHSFFFIVAPILAGGVGEGALPLSVGYAATLHQKQGDLFAQILPAVMLGGLTAILIAGGLNLLGKRRPGLTGEGRLQPGESAAVAAAPANATAPDVSDIAAAAVTAVALYLVGVLVQQRSGWPAPVVMLALAVLLKLGRVASPRLEGGAAAVFRFFATAVTYPLLFAIGVALTPWDKLVAAFNPAELAVIVATVATLIGVGFVTAPGVGLYPIDAAIVNACHSGQGGTGDVAILTAANRMPLMPFAQIATRIGGALTVATTRDLHRGMKVLGALILTLSAATPASSIFVIVPDVLSAAGTGALIAMGLAALIAICVAQVYAELGSAFPLAGGEYAMVGRILGPWAGFAVLGLNLVNSLLATAVLALGVSPYLAAAGFAEPQNALALMVVAGATLLSILNIRTNALVTGLFVAVELASLVVLAILGAAHPERSLTGMLAHPAIYSGATPTAATPAMIGLGVAAAIFAYDGYGSAVYFGEELHQARKGIGRAIVWALAITVAAEVIPLAAVLSGAPDLKALLGSGAGLVDFLGVRGGPLLKRVISLGIALAIVNAVIAMVLLTARQLFATGRDEAWPGPVNGALARVHPRLRSPWVATLAAGGLASGLCLVNQTLLIVATGTGAAVIYGALCVAVLAGRRSGATDHGHHRMPLYPWVPIATLSALCGVLYADWLDPDIGRPGLFIALGVAAASALYYAVAVRGRGRWTLRGPQDGVEDQSSDGSS